MNALAALLLRLGVSVNAPDPEAALWADVATLPGGVDLEDDAVPEEEERAQVSRIELSPTQAAFVFADEDVVILMGSRGEGKTTAGIQRVLRVAADPAHQPFLPLRVAQVRDTWVNLERSIIVTLKEGHRRGWWHTEFKESGRQCLLNGDAAHLYLFGMDRPADANAFQSFEAGLVSIEEPAPAADLASGVPAEVFALGVTSLRQRGIRTSLQILTNPPDEGHWVLDLVEQLTEAHNATMTCRMFRIPVGENRHLDPGYRVKMRLALEAAGRPDLVRRLVEGQVGTVQVGVAVTPQFSDLHVWRGDEPMVVKRGWPTYRSFDFGRSPAYVCAQTSPRGHLNVLGCLVGSNMGIEELIESHVIPWERSVGLWPPRPARADGYGGRDRGTVIRTFGDPAGNTREATRSEWSARKALEHMLRTTFEPGPVPWAPRRDSVHGVLMRMIGGRPMVQIDPECVPLIHALRGAWRYHRTPSGIVSEQPVKDEASHISDAFSYLTAKLFPVERLTEPKDRVQGSGVPKGPRPSSWMGV